MRTQAQAYLTAVILTSGLLAASPQVALACSYFEGTFVPDTVPLNAALYIERSCAPSSPACPLPDELEVFELETGTQISGSLIHLSDYTGRAYWKPDQALTEGATYEVRNAGHAEWVTEPRSYPRFTAAPRLARDLKMTSATLSAEAQPTASGESIACLGGPSPCDSTPPEVTVFTRRQYRPSLSITFRGLPFHWDSNAPVQYLIQTTFYADGETVSERLTNYADAGFVFEQDAASYCYKSVVRSLLDDQEEKIFEGCTPHSAFDLREEAVPEQELKQALYSECWELLDEAYREQWCQAQRLLCDLEQDSCEQRLEESCPPATENEGEEEDASDTPKGKKPRSKAFSCAIDHATPSRDGFLFALVLFLLALASRRRRAA